jgi:hypothetical protein
METPTPKTQRRRRAATTGAARLTAGDVRILLQEGEGTTLEFKENLCASLARELVAMANTIGGRILIGVRDDATVAGVKDSNSLRARIHDIARNCDPPRQGARRARGQGRRGPRPALPAPAGREVATRPRAAPLDALPRLGEGRQGRHRGRRRQGGGFLRGHARDERAAQRLRQPAPRRGAGVAGGGLPRHRDRHAAAPRVVVRARRGAPGGRPALLLLPAGGDRDRSVGPPGARGG